jgi:hypothetical protein
VQPRNHDILLQSLDVVDDRVFLERLRSVAAWEGTIRADLRHFSGVMMRCRRILQDQLVSMPFITVDGPLPVKAEDVIVASLAPAECIRFLTLLVHSCVNKALFIGHEVISSYLGARWLVLADSALLLASALMEPARFYLAKEEDSYHEAMSKDKVLISRLLAIAETWPGIAHQPCTPEQAAVIPFKRTHLASDLGPLSLVHCATVADHQLPDTICSLTLEFQQMVMPPQHELDIAALALSEVCASYGQVARVQSANGWEMSRLYVPSIASIMQSIEGRDLPPFAAPWMLTVALARAFHVPDGDMFGLYVKVRRALEAKRGRTADDGTSERRYGLFRQLIALSAALHCDSTTILEDTSVFSSSSPLLGEDIAELALCSSDAPGQTAWEPLSVSMPSAEKLAPSNVVLECQHLREYLSAAVQRRALQSLAISAASALYVSVNADDAQSETHLTTESLACAWHLGLSARVISALPVYESRLPDEVVRNRKLWLPLLSLLRIARHLIDGSADSTSLLQPSHIGAEFAQTVVGYIGQLLPSIEKDAVPSFASAVVDILLCEAGDVDSTLVCTMAAGALSEAVMHESLSARWMGAALRSIGLEKLCCRLYAELRLHTDVGMMVVEHMLPHMPEDEDAFVLGPPALTATQRIRVLSCFPEYRKELCAAICDVLTDSLQPTDGVAMNEVAAISAAGAALLQPAKEVLCENEVRLSPKLTKISGILDCDAAMVRTLKLCLTFPDCFGGGMLQILSQLMDSIVSGDPSLCVILFDAGVTPMILCALFRGRLPFYPALLVALPTILHNLLLTESVRERVRRYHLAREIAPRALGASKIDATSPLLGVLPVRSPLVQGLHGEGERVQRRRSGSLVDLSNLVTDIPINIVPGSFEFNVLHAPRSLPHFQVVESGKDFVRRLQGCDWDESMWNALTASQQIIRACIFAQVDMVSLSPLSVLECTCSSRTQLSQCTSCVVRQPAHALAISHRFEIECGTWRPVLSNVDLYARCNGAPVTSRQGITVWTTTSASFDMASVQRVAACHPFGVPAAQALVDYARMVHCSIATCESGSSRDDLPIEPVFSCPFWEHDDVSTVMPRSRFVDQYGTLHSGIDKSMLQDLATHYVEGFETSHDEAAVIAEALRLSMVNISAQLVKLRSTPRLRDQLQDANSGDKRRRDGLKVGPSTNSISPYEGDVWYTACLNHLSTGFIFVTSVLRQLTKQASSPLHDRLYAAVLMQPMWQAHGWAVPAQEPQLIDVLTYDPSCIDPYGSTLHVARMAYLERHVCSPSAAINPVIDAACRIITTGGTLFAALPLLYMLFNPHGGQFFRGLADAHAEHAIEAGCPPFVDVMRELRANVHRPVSGPTPPKKPFSERWWPCLQHIVDSMSDLRSYWGKANVCETSLVPGIQLLKGCLTVIYSDPRDDDRAGDAHPPSFTSDFLKVFASQSDTRVAFTDFHGALLAHNTPLQMVVNSDLHTSSLAKLYACIYAMQGIALSAMIIEDGMVGAFRNLTPSVLLSRIGWDTVMRRSYYNWIWHSQWQRFIVHAICSTIVETRGSVIRCLLDQAFSCVGLLRASPSSDSAPLTPVDALADLFVGAAANITSLLATLVSAATIVPPGALPNPTNEDGTHAKVIKFTHLGPYAGSLLEEMSDSLSVAFSCTFLTSCEAPFAAWMQAVAVGSAAPLPDSATGVRYAFDVVAMFYSLLICPAALCFGGVGGDEYAKLLTQPAMSALLRRSHVQALIQLDNSYRSNTLMLYAASETGFLAQLVRICTYMVGSASSRPSPICPPALWASLDRHNELINTASDGGCSDKCVMVIPPTPPVSAHSMSRASESLASAIMMGSTQFALMLEHIASFECQCSSGYTLALTRNDCRIRIANELLASNAERLHVLTIGSTDAQSDASTALSPMTYHSFHGPRFIQAVLMSVARESRDLWEGSVTPPPYVAKALVDVLHSLHLLDWDTNESTHAADQTGCFSVWRCASGCALRPVAMCNFDAGTDPCAGYSEAYLPGFIVLPNASWPLHLPTVLSDGPFSYCTRCGFIFSTPRELLRAPCGQCHAVGDYSTAIIRRPLAELASPQGSMAVGDVVHSATRAPTLPEGSMEALCGMGFSRGQVLSAVRRVNQTLEDDSQGDDSLADAVAEYLLAHAMTDEADDSMPVVQLAPVHSESTAVSVEERDVVARMHDAVPIIPNSVKAAWSAEWAWLSNHQRVPRQTSVQQTTTPSSVPGATLGGMWQLAWSIIDSPHALQLEPNQMQFRTSCEQRAVLAAVNAKILGPSHFCGRFLLPGVFVLFQFIRTLCEEVISKDGHNRADLEAAARIHESLEGCNLQQHMVSGITAVNAFARSWSSATRLEILGSLPSTFRIMCRLVSFLQFDSSSQSLQCRLAVVRTLPSLYTALHSSEACGVWLECVDVSHATHLFSKKDANAAKLHNFFLSAEESLQLLEGTLVLLQHSDLLPHDVRACITLVSQVLRSYFPLSAVPKGREILLRLWEQLLCLGFLRVIGQQLQRRTPLPTGCENFVDCLGLILVDLSANPEDVFAERVFLFHAQLQAQFPLGPNEHVLTLQQVFAQCPAHVFLNPLIGRAFASCIRLASPYRFVGSVPTFHRANLQAALHPNSDEFESSDLENRLRAGRFATQVLDACAHGLKMLLGSKPDWSQEIDVPSALPALLVNSSNGVADASAAMARLLHQHRQSPTSLESCVPSSIVHLLRDHTYDDIILVAAIARVLRSKSDRDGVTTAGSILQHPVIADAAAVESGRTVHVLDWVLSNILCYTNQRTGDRDNAIAALFESTHPLDERPTIGGNCRCNSHVRFDEARRIAALEWLSLLKGIARRSSPSDPVVNFILHRIVLALSNAADKGDPQFERDRTRACMAICTVLNEVAEDMTASLSHSLTQPHKDIRKGPELECLATRYLFCKIAKSGLLTVLVRVGQSFPPKSLVGKLVSSVTSPLLQQLLRPDVTQQVLSKRAAQLVALYHVNRRKMLEKVAIIGCTWKAFDATSWLPELPQVDMAPIVSTISSNMQALNMSEVQTVGFLCHLVRDALQGIESYSFSVFQLQHLFVTHQVEVDEVVAAPDDDRQAIVADLQLILRNLDFSGYAHLKDALLRNAKSSSSLKDLHGDFSAETNRRRHTSEVPKAHVTAAVGSIEEHDHSADIPIDTDGEVEGSDINEDESVDHGSDHEDESIDEELDTDSSEDQESPSSADIDGVFIQSNSGSSMIDNTFGDEYGSVASGGTRGSFASENDSGDVFDDTAFQPNRQDEGQSVDIRMHGSSIVSAGEFTDEEAIGGDNDGMRAHVQFPWAGTQIDDEDGDGGMHELVFDHNSLLLSHSLWDAGLRVDVDAGEDEQDEDAQIDNSEDESGMPDLARYIQLQAQPISRRSARRPRDHHGNDSRNNELLHEIELALRLPTKRKVDGSKDMAPSDLLHALSVPGVPVTLLAVIIEALFRFAASSGENHLSSCPLFSRPKHFQPEHPIWHQVSIPAGLTYSPEPASIGEALSSADSLKFVDAVHTIYATLESYIADVGFASYIPTGIVAVASLPVLPCAASTYAYLLSPDKGCIVLGGTPYVGTASIKFANGCTVLEEYRPTGDRYQRIAAASTRPFRNVDTMSSATAINDSASHIVHEATAGSDSDDWACAKFVSEVQSETSLLSSLINSRLGSAQAQMRAQLQTSWAKLFAEVAASLDAPAPPGITETEDGASTWMSMLRTAGEHAKATGRLSNLPLVALDMSLDDERTVALMRWLQNVRALAGELPTYTASTQLSKNEVIEGRAADMALLLNFADGCIPQAPPNNALKPEHALQRLFEMRHSALRCLMERTPVILSEVHRRAGELDILRGSLSGTVHNTDGGDAVELLFGSDAALRSVLQACVDAFVLMISILNCVDRVIGQPFALACGACLAIHAPNQNAPNNAFPTLASIAPTDSWDRTYAFMSISQREDLPLEFPSVEPTGISSQNTQQLCIPMFGLKQLYTDPISQDIKVWRESFVHACHSAFHSIIETSDWATRRCVAWLQFCYSQSASPGPMGVPDMAIPVNPPQSLLLDLSAFRHLLPRPETAHAHLEFDLSQLVLPANMQAAFAALVARPQSGLAGPTRDPPGGILFANSTKEEGALPVFEASEISHDKLGVSDAARTAALSRLLDGLHVKLVMGYRHSPIVERGMLEEVSFTREASISQMLHGTDASAEASELANPARLATRSAMRNGGLVMLRPVTKRILSGRRTSKIVASLQLNSVAGSVESQGMRAFSQASFSLLMPSDAHKGKEDVFPLFCQLQRIGVQKYGDMDSDFALWWPIDNSEKRPHAGKFKTYFPVLLHRTIALRNFASASSSATKIEALTLYDVPTPAMASDRKTAAAVWSGRAFPRTTRGNTLHNLLSHLLHKVLDQSLADEVAAVIACNLCANDSARRQLLDIIVRICSSTEALTSSALPAETHRVIRRAHFLLKRILSRYPSAVFSVLDQRKDKISATSGMKRNVSGQQIMWHLRTHPRNCCALTTTGSQPQLLAKLTMSGTKNIREAYCNNGCLQYQTIQSAPIQHSCWSM